ncbi:MAG TPA: DinB family protein [Chitinophagales bacterium]|nr:DinB family protein [Chitinophagales bacterium]HRK28546.1 DinB family protein [Chitinophagales bacterium]
MKNVLVLCTGNSCRSQIAEGFLRHFAGGVAHIYSAGVETHGVNPRAIATMKEAGIDISQHTSNHVNEYAHLSFDFVITVCDNAREQCPYFPTKALKIHQNFPDPAKAAGSEEEVMAEFARVRSMIRDFCAQFVQTHLITKTQTLLAMWQQARNRYTQLLAHVAQPDLQKHLPPATNSAGFLIAHIADVELLFAKNVFGNQTVKVHAKTVIAQKDTGEWANLPQLLQYERYACQCLEQTISEQTNADWLSPITTKEFGTMSKEVALSRIISHTAYHAGQLALLLKYGQ